MARPEARWVACIGDAEVGIRRAWRSFAAEGLSVSKDKIDKLAALGSRTEEQLAFSQEVVRADLTLTALAVAIHVLRRIPLEREQGDLKAMKLMFHELAGEDGELWLDRAKYLLEGGEASP